MAGVASACAAGVAGLALAGIGAGGAGRATAAGAPLAPAREVTIGSPRPIFLQWQGPDLSGHRVVWTATTGEGQTGSEADRIYAYDLDARRLTIPVYSHYGTSGFIGSYVLVGDKLAYVDTNVSAGGIFTWRIVIADVRRRTSQTIAASSPRDSSVLPPQIAFDGAHMLVLQTVGPGHAGVATLYTPALHRRRVLAEAPKRSFADPALTGDLAFWTASSFGPRPVSRLTMYDLRRATARTLPVGDVSQVAASGDLLVWKTGLSGVGGHIGLYSLRRRRLLSTDLAHSETAIFPSIHGPLVSWTYANGSRVQIYSVGAGRVIYSAPAEPHRIYGLTSVSDRVVSWFYTVLPVGHGNPRGYVVVHPVR